MYPRCVEQGRAGAPPTTVRGEEGLRRRPRPLYKYMGEARYTLGFWHPEGVPICTPWISGPVGSVGRYCLWLTRNRVESVIPLQGAWIWRIILPIYVCIYVCIYQSVCRKAHRPWGYEYICVPFPRQVGRRSIRRNTGTTDIGWLAGPGHSGTWHLRQSLSSTTFGHYDTQFRATLITATASWLPSHS